MMSTCQALNAALCLQAVILTTTVEHGGQVLRPGDLKMKATTPLKTSATDPISLFQGEPEPSPAGVSA